MTSDERREVAARLRKTRGIMAFVDALGIDPDGDWCWTDVSRRVADLIDPTCHRERKRVVVDDYRRDTLILPVCSACGFMFDKRMPKPNFCPHCGARLVERGED